MAEQHEKNKCAQNNSINNKKKQERLTKKNKIKTEKSSKNNNSCQRKPKPKTKTDQSTPSRALQRNAPQEKARKCSFKNANVHLSGHLLRNPLRLATLRPRICRTSNFLLICQIIQLNFLRNAVVASEAGFRFSSVSVVCEKKGSSAAWECYWNIIYKCYVKEIMRALRPVWLYVCTYAVYCLYSEFVFLIPTVRSILTTV